MTPHHDPSSSAEAVKRRGGRSTVRALWIVAGWVALALGAIGAVLPVLPTTPFVLLAAFAFGRGSPRLRKWLVDHRHFGPVIHNWEAHRVIERRYKILACMLMGLTFTASVLTGLSALVLTIQAVCMGAAAIYVLSRPSGTRQRIKAKSPDGEQR